MFSGVVLDVFLGLYWMFPGVALDVSWSCKGCSWICTGCFLDLYWIFPGFVLYFPGVVLDVRLIET